MSRDIQLWVVLTAVFVLWCFWPNIKEAIHRHRRESARDRAERNHPSRYRRQ